MKKRNYVVRLVSVVMVIGGLGMMAFALSGCSQFSTRSNNQSDADIKKLQQLSLLIRSATGESEHAPGTFSAIAGSALLPPGSVNPRLFVCPSTGHSPGPMDSVGAWSDYIYVGKMDDEISGAALVIDPPENHHGEYGLVLWSEFYVSRVSPKEIRRLIADPFCMDRVNSAEVLEAARKKIKIQIPERLKHYYSAK